MRLRPHNKLTALAAYQTFLGGRAPEAPAAMSTILCPACNVARQVQDLQRSFRYTLDGPFFDTKSGDPVTKVEAVHTIGHAAQLLGLPTRLHNGANA